MLEALAEELDSAQLPERRSRRAEVALRRSNYARRMGDNAGASAALREAVRLAQAAQDRRCEADARMRWGSFLNTQGDQERARDQCEQALTLARECGAREIEAESLASIGWILLSQESGSLAAVAACFERAGDIYRETGDRRGEAATAYRRGIVSRYQGDLPRARASYERALDMQREIGNRPAEAAALDALSLICRGQDDYEAAVAASEQSLVIQGEAGGPLGQAHSRANLAWVLAEQGFYAQAESFCWQALRFACESGDRGREGVALLIMGLIHYHQGDYAEVRTVLEQCRRSSRDAGEGWVESASLGVLSLVSHVEGDDEAALDYAQQTLETVPAEWHLGEGNSALVLGHALAGLGDGAGAIAAYRQALDSYHRSGHINPPMEVLAGLARLGLAQGDQSQALQHVEPILDHLMSHTLNGTYEPFRIRLTCYRVLVANDGPHAGEVLQTAYNLLQERAAGIEDEHLRRSFLEAVPWHRELVEEAERAGLLKTV